MNELSITKKNGMLVIDSREVADMIGKNHNKLLRDIRTYCEYLGKSSFGHSEFFIESSYQSEQNKNMPCYLLTRKGCDMVANKMTGEKGVLFTATYIECFYKMEAQLRQLDNRANLLLQIYSGGQEGVLAAKLLTDIEVKEATTPLLAKIEEDKPLRDFAEHVTKSTDTIDIGGLARLAKDEHINIGRNRLFEYLRSKKILMKDNTPYQRYIENMWFEVVEIVKQTPYGEKLFLKTLVTGKGQLGVIEMLRRDFNNAE